MNREEIICPGETIKELLEVHNLTQEELAKKLQVNVKTVNEIINGKGVITTETAFKLGMIFDISPSFWNNLEFNYRLELKEFEDREKSQEEYKIVKDIYNDIARRGWVPDVKDKNDRVQSVKKYLKIVDFKQMEEEFEKIACRRTITEKFSKLNFMLWVQWGLKQANEIEVNNFNKTGLLNSIEKIRSLTNYEDQERARSELQEICKENGVVLVYSSVLSNTSVQGIAKWVNPNKALIQISDRRKRVATFWFTFMHELGHIINGNKKEFYIDFSDEMEADDFARNTLIPKTDYNNFVKKANISFESIKDFSTKIGISPDIVAGRLAHDYNAYHLPLLRSFDRELNF